MEVVASLSQGRTAAAQCGLFTHKSVPVIFEPPYTLYVTDDFYELLRRMFCCVLRSLTIFITECKILRMVTS